MTNAEIIYKESQRLLAEGVLKIGGYEKWQDVENGEDVLMPVAEEIHTFNGWKERGYIVRKGEHAKAKFAIWKFTQKKGQTTDEGKTGEEAPQTSMFMKNTAWFTSDQVEPIKA